jgi:apolipoprotein D and lipocalin family protein
MSVSEESLKHLIAAGTLALLTFCLFGCGSASTKFKGVDGFQKEKYLGKWYEVARFDFRFEKDLNNTSAEYSLRKDGAIQVVNRGTNYKTLKPKEATGKARFRGSDTIAELEVSFFGPFYGDYNVIALDKDYQYALIAGSNTDYLWILSRTKQIPDSTRREYLDIAKNNGFDTTRLIWVEHSK